MDAVRHRRGKESVRRPDARDGRCERRRFAAHGDASAASEPCGAWATGAATVHSRSGPSRLPFDEVPVIHTHCLGVVPWAAGRTLRSVARKTTARAQRERDQEEHEKGESSFHGGILANVVDNSLTKIKCWLRKEPFSELSRIGPSPPWHLRQVAP